METNDKLTALRKKAELFLNENKNNKKKLQFDDFEKLIEELNIAHIELEMQNLELQETNQKLETERKTYRSLFLDAPIAYITVNQTGNILQINNCAAEILGLHVSQFKYTSIFPYLEENSKIKFTKYFKSIFNTENVSLDEITLIDSANKPLHAKLHTKTYFDTQLNEKLCRLTITDISREKKLLAQSEQKFTQLFDAIGDPVFIHDFDTNILLTNKAACRITGYSSDEIAKLKIKDFEIKDDIKKINQRVEQLQQTGQAVFEAAHQSKSGKIYPVEVHAKIIDFEGQKAIMSITRNITNRKKRETELLKFKTAVEQSPVSIVVTDPNGDIEYVNPKFTELAGYSYDEAIGNNPRVLKTEHTPKETFTDLWKTILGKKIWKGEFTNKRKDGSLFHEAATISPIVNSENEIISFIAVKEDITEQKEIQTALKQSEQKFRKLFNSINDAVFIHPDTEKGFGKFVEVNDVACQRYGYTRNELLQMTPADLTVFKDHYELADKEKRHQLLEKQRVFEAVQVTKTGEKIPVEISSSLIELNGQTYLQSVVRDITERKKAEQLIKENEQKFRTIFENSPQAMALTDIENGTLSEINHTFCQKIKIPKEQLIGSTTIQNGFFSPEQRQQFTGELMQNGKVADFEISYTNPAGETYNALMYANTIQVKNKNYILSMFVDITEKRQLENRLLYSASVIRAAMESSSDSFFIFDTQMNILEFNHNAEKYARNFWKREIKRGDSMFEFTKIAKLSEVFARDFKKALAGQTIIDERPIKIDDTELWFRSVFTPVITQENKTIGVSFNASDITERKQFEIKQAEWNAELQTMNEELKTSNDQLNETNQTLEVERNQFVELLDSIPENIYVSCRESYEIIFANKHLKNELGEDIVGKKCYTTLRGFNEACDFCTNHIIFSKNEPHYWEKYNEEQKKHYYHIDRAIKWTDGRDARFQLSIDITKLKEYEHQLIELNATKDKFFSIISHDLKSPFNSILGFTQLLVKNIEKYDKPKIAKFIDRINSSSKQAFKLLENLLEWSRSQTGKIEFIPENVILENIFQETVTILQSNANEKSIEIINNQSDAIIINADRNMIFTVLRNLISNAIKFTPRNGKITLDAEIREKRVKISVSDTGVGMDNEKIGKLFKISEKVTTEGTANERGTGLGLLICKEFIDKHNSEISVESEIDKGTTFSFYLDLVE